MNVKAAGNEAEDDDDAVWKREALVRSFGRSGVSNGSKRPRVTRIQFVEPGFLGKARHVGLAQARGQRGEPDFSLN